MFAQCFIGQAIMSLDQQIVKPSLSSKEHMGSDPPADIQNTNASRKCQGCKLNLSPRASFELNLPISYDLQRNTNSIPFR
ncbi:hypothetical protein SLE2022_366070 [Rubroshorea leprosula]